MISILTHKVKNVHYVKLRKKITPTQANAVPVGVNGFSYNHSQSHDQCGYKDADDGSRVRRGGC